MIDIDVLLKMSTEEQITLIKDQEWNSESINSFLENDVEFHSSIYIWLIIYYGSKISETNLSKLINKEDDEIIEAICDNHNIKLSIHNMRDICRIVGDEECLTRHPSYTDFWREAFVHTENDFLAHTKNHIKNVNILAYHVINHILNNPELKQYFNIPENAKDDDIVYFITTGMKLHDKAKICEDDEFLKKNNLKEAMYKTLFYHYGKGLTTELKQVVNKLNSIDHSIVEEYLSGSEQWLVDLFYKVEKISDCIERGCNKITPEEMKQDVIIPSKYLENILSKPELSIVKKIEQLYPLYCDNIL